VGTVTEPAAGALQPGRMDATGGSGQQVRRAAVLATGLLVLVVGCSSANVAAPAPREEASSGSPPPTPTPAEQVPAAPPEDTRSALSDRFDERLPDPLIDPAAFQQGGPPPDGIPAIDEPTFQPADTVDWLSRDEPLLSLTVSGETRGYPLQVMTWHEIVNDTVGGAPVAVTYCPLCNSGVAFERAVDGRVLSFGTSGMLYADNLVMYDRQTESLWPQLTGQAAVGVLTGTSLTAIPMGIVAWEDFREANPDALVLSRDTGFDRPYGRNPYVGYDDPEGGLLFGLPADTDDRLPVKERVIGLRDGDDSVAVVRDSTAAASPAEITVGDRALVLWHKTGQRSALDTATITEGQEVGTVTVYDPVLDGRHLHFAEDGDGFRDLETGSRWDILGRATAGPLEGAELEEYRHLDTFWFAWVTFNPDTRVLDLQDSDS
jgi:hypothetical protein